MVTHHPSLALIVGFATGELPLGPGLAVRLHIDACPQCRAAAATLEEAEGRLLESLPASPLQPNALQDVLAMIDADPEAPIASPVASPAEGLRFPEAVAQIGLARPIHMAPGTWVAHLDAAQSEGWRTYVFCGKAGTALPRHGHLGDELIVVLEGQFSDGREFFAGDFAENKAGFIHDMAVSGDGRCVALISAAGPIDWAPPDRSLGALLGI